MQWITLWDKCGLHPCQRDTEKEIAEWLYGRTRWTMATCNDAARHVAAGSLVQSPRLGLMVLPGCFHEVAEPHPEDLKRELSQT